MLHMGAIASPLEPVRAAIVAEHHRGAYMAKSFPLVVVDRDEKVFSIHGPMSDDRPWNGRVCAAQKAGRQVNCSTPADWDRATVVADMKAQLGFEEVSSVPLPHASLN